MGLLSSLRFDSDPLRDIVKQKRLFLPAAKSHFVFSPSHAEWDVHPALHSEIKNKAVRQGRTAFSVWVEDGIRTHDFRNHNPTF
jgi:hypothetical protein